MQREKFPEKIPFRLTRMLVNAMEVSGIHGSYKKSCEVTMDVLRDNKDSLMAVLEAFVYDPLIAWRLIANATKDAERERELPQLFLVADRLTHCYPVDSRNNCGWPRIPITAEGQDR
jgi:phosphatidylinositol kinase/protein kinase (PI-3  family)